ncbi:MAG: lipocalin family protein [Candidatus Pacebacteria bacterium]|nr:lipocalin family protein [Candidatus Paceibacterota bacterium]
MPKDHEPIRFPADESAHDTVVEWWYWNGHLKDAQGKEYAFMDCLFKVDIQKVKIPFLSKIPFKMSYFSHSLVTDIGGKSFSHRASPISIVSDDSFLKPSLYISYVNPAFKNSFTDCIIEKTGDSAYHLKNEDIDLRLSSSKAPLLEGGDGFIDLQSTSTYYYSLTSLVTEGRIKVGGEWVEVTGKSWMDHQWADSSYSKDRWNWFSVQLDGDTEMVCCAYDNGSVKTYFAGVSHPDGRQDHYSEVEIVPMEKSWTSPKSKATYPLSWKIKIPAARIELDMSARNEDQEVLFGSINYWEGPLAVTGTLDGKEVAGAGFAELVGYPSHYGSIRYLNDEIRKTIRQSFVFLKKSRDASKPKP